MRLTSRRRSSRVELEARSDLCRYADRLRDAGRGDADVAVIVRRMPVACDSRRRVQIWAEYENAPRASGKGMGSNMSRGRRTRYAL